MNYRNPLALVASLCIFSLPVMAFGATPSYQPLVGIPGITDPGLNFGDYINALYAFSISIAALLAVIKIVIAGMKYMLSDVVTSKSEAISDIQGSVFGLIIVISAVLILTVINPSITKTDIFITPVTSTTNTPSATGPGTVISKNGYKYAKAGTVANFKTSCTSAPGSIYRLEAGNDVCYDPLPPASVTALDSAFNVASNPDGSLYYPNTDRDALLKRFQTAHYPRLIANTASIKADHSATDVLLGVKITAENDWLDKANQSSLVATCADFQRALGKNVRYVTGGSLSGGTAYIACIVN